MYKVLLASSMMLAGSAFAAETNPQADMIKKGKALFASKTCVTCHGVKGEGKPYLGPNLTDLFMVNGADKAAVKKVIADGSPKNPMMIAWKNSLSAQEIDAITEYVWSITGTNVKGRKAEGKAFKK